MTYEMKLREERKLGQEEGKADMILSLLKKNMGLDFIQETSHWTREVILQLAHKNGIIIRNAN